MNVENEIDSIKITLDANLEELYAILNLLRERIEEIEHKVNALGDMEKA